MFYSDANFFPRSIFCYLEIFNAAFIQLCSSINPVNQRNSNRERPYFRKGNENKKYKKTRLKTWKLFFKNLFLLSKESFLEKQYKTLYPLLLLLSSHITALYKNK